MRQVGSSPERMRNLYFAFLVVLRALVRQLFCASKASKVSASAFWPCATGVCGLTLRISDELSFCFAFLVVLRALVRQCLQRQYLSSFCTSKISKVRTSALTIFFACSCRVEGAGARTCKLKQARASS